MGEGSSRVAQARALIDAADAGRPEELSRWTAPPDPSHEEQAWALAIASARWLEGLGPRPDTAALETLAESTAGRAGAARAYALLARAAALAFDGRALADAAAGLRRTAAPNSVEALWLGAAQAWQALLSGEHQEATAAGQQLFGAAQAKRAVPLVIEATAVRALAALGARDLDEATRLARRASLMARTEGIAPAEVLANVVLARLRRHTGRPHLAVHILSAVARLPTKRLPGWLAWELLLAGGIPALEAALPGALATEPDSPAAHAARALARALGGAARGDRAAFDGAARELQAAAGVFRDVADEAALAISALDVTREPPRMLAPWCRGEGLEPPLGLHGLCAADTEDEQATSFVVAPPEAPARRVLRAGVALAPGGEEAERRAPARYGRADAALAALLLAGSAGMSLSELFRATYGFGYRPLTHASILAVTVHRLRARLGDAGEVIRSADEIRLVLRRPLVVPDPRCPQPIADRVVRLLASCGAAQASEIAGGLNVPLRTVQHALKRLAAEGSCRIERAGRTFNYRIEDTTFSEPTAVRTGPRRG